MDIPVVSCKYRFSDRFAKTTDSTSAGQVLSVKCTGDEVDTGINVKSTQSTFDSFTRSY